MQKFCTQCGKKRDEVLNFCTYCSALLGIRSLNPKLMIEPRRLSKRRNWT